MGAISTLLVNLELNSARFRRDLDNSRRRTRSFANDVRVSFSTASKVIAGTGVAAASALGVIYAQSAKSADQLTKFADRVGISTERLGGLRYAAELTGVAQSKLDMGLQRVVRRVAEAAQGTGEAKAALKELGLDAQKLVTLSPDQQFAAIAEKMKDVGNQGDRVRLSMKLFDSEGVALVNTLALGADGLAAVQTEAEQLGITLSRIDAAKIEAANDAMTRAGGISKAFGNSLTTELAPIVAAVANEFVQSAKAAGGMNQVVVNGIGITTEAAAFVANMGRGLKVTFLTARLAVAEFFNILNQGVVALEGIGGKVAEWLGFDAGSDRKMKEFSDSFSDTVAGFREELQTLALEEMPGDKVKAWVSDIQAKAQAAAEEVAANSQINIGGSLAGTNVDSAKKEVETIVSLQQEKFKRIHEAALQSENKLAELENYRFERENEKLLADMERLQERGLLTQELQQQFRDAELEAKQIHEQKLSDIEREAEEERNRQRFEGYSALLSVAEDYYSGLEGKEAAYARAAISIGQTLLDEKKRESLKKIVASTETAAMGAYEALASIPYVGPFLGAAAAAGIVATGAVAAAKVTGIAHDGIDTVPREGTWLLDKGERVVDRRTNEDLKQFLKSQQISQSTTNTTNHFNVNVQAGRDGFVRPESVRQVEAATFNAMRRASMRNA